MTAPSVARNVVANYAGRIWTGAMGLVFLPFYVRLMGIESYGLVGVFASITALTSVLDMGLSSTLTRELARASASTGPGSARESRDLVRTLEVLYWGVGLGIGIGVAALAPVLARRWLTPAGIQPATVAHAISIMGVVIAMQWPASLYDGALTGIQRQVLLNCLRAAIATVQGAGAVLVLWLVSPTVVAFFVWQIPMSVAGTLLLRHFAWRSLPPSEARGTFRLALLGRLWRFAAGMTGISVTTIVLTQTDKIILTRLLPLTVFGHYVVATNVASIIVQLVSPLFFALFPRFAQLLAERGDEADVSAMYHQACQSVSALVLPAAAILAFFPRELLLLWMHDPVIADNVAPLARLLVIGQALNAMMFMPMMIQLAHGWTRLTVLTNVIAAIVLVPLTTQMVARQGAVGGAAVWVMLNAGYVVVQIPLLHRRLLKTEMWNWYRNDFVLPMAVVACVGALSRLLMPPGASALASLFWITVTGGAALLAAVLAMPDTRARIRRLAASGS